MYKVFALFAAAVLPGVAAAQGIAQSSDAGPFQDLLINILDFSNDVLIPFIIGIGFLFFVWGIFKYFIFGGASDDAKESGKSLIIWATIGFVLIIVFWGIVNLLTESTGLANVELQNIPTIDVP
jgi:uncharacterized membrane protein YidH (DUF202 family)